MPDFVDEMMSDEDASIGELLLGDDDGDDDGVGSLPTNDDVASLNNALSEKDKQIQGLLSATKEERRKRQDTAAQLKQLTDTVNGILSTRQQSGMESLSESEATEAKRQGLAVKYDEDGNAWVDDSGLQDMLTPLQQEIMDLKRQLQLTNVTSAAADAAEKVKQAIISEDERYGPAANRYRAARKWVEDQVAGYMREHGVRKAMSPGAALDEVFDKTLENEFAEAFKGIDLVDIVTAEDSERHFRRTLSNIATALEPKDEPKPKAMDSRFQQVLKKPSALGSNANAKAGQLTISEKVGNLSTMDIMDLSDSQIKALMKAMEKEETEDGIKF